MLAYGSDAAKRTAILRQDWLDLKADLRRWTWIERYSAGVIAVAVATLPAAVTLFGHG